MAENEHPNAQVMLKAFRAVQNGDTDTFWAAQQDDVQATVAGGGDLAGEFRGKGDQDWIPCQVFAKLSEQSAVARPKKLTVEQVLAGDDHAVLLYQVTSGDRGQPRAGAIVAKVIDGRLSEVRHFDPLASGGGLKTLLSG
jgi:ketosteroid isomerase-like protein